MAEIFDETFRLYRRNFLVMLILVGVFQIPLVVVTLPYTVWQAGWLQAQAESRGAVLFGSSAWPVEQLDELTAFVVTGLVAGLAVILLGTFAAAAITYVAGRAKNGDRPRAGEAFLALRGLVRSLLGYVTLLVAGWVVLVAGLAMAAFIGATAASRAMGGSVGGAIAVVVLVGLIGMVIVVIAGTRLALSIPILVLERQAPMDALRRSWSLVGGSTWRTLGILYLAGLVIAVIGGIFSPVFLPGVFQGLLSGSLWSYILVALVGGAVQTVVGPILPTLVTVLYFDYAAERPESLPCR